MAIMPPRIQLFQCLKAPHGTRQPHHPRDALLNIPVTRSASCTRSFTSSSQCQASTGAQRRKHRDPYAVAQAKARKAANLSRQQVLKQERAAALGDPVRGITTPYLESFDTALPPEPSPPFASTKTRIDESPDTKAAGPKVERDEHLNYFLSTSELEKGLAHSKWLSTPMNEPGAPEGSTREDEMSAEQKKAHREMQQQTAEEALKRISSLSLASGQDRLRVNTMRCIEDFGRHNTDATLEAKALASTGRPSSLLEKTPRAGPDTGSSEVQIAILTAKIRSLEQFLSGRGRQDKNGKRDLRLLVHRRQKLLRYLRRKERGGPRWQNLIEKLGLTDGTWKSEISLA